MKQYTVVLMIDNLNEKQMNAMMAYMEMNGFKGVSCLNTNSKGNRMTVSRITGTEYAQSEEEVSDKAARLLDYACMPCHIMHCVCEVSVCIQCVIGGGQTGEHVGIRSKGKYEFVTNKGMRRYIRKLGLDAFDEEGLVMDNRDIGS